MRRVEAMPLFLCRWPNGDCSVVWARNTADAIGELDQVGNAERCPITQLREFQVHFVLTDHGELALDGLGEGTREEVFSFAYPVLDEALSHTDGDASTTASSNHGPTRGAAIADAVEEERRRIEVDETRIAEPQTELGRDIKSKTDMPTMLIDRAVRQRATKTLRHFKGRAKPS